MKTLLIAMLLAVGAPWGLPGATLQDWLQLNPGKDMGTWADAAGSKVDVTVAPGPTDKEQALQIDCQIVQWGGAWANAKAPLGAGTGIRFQARSSVPQQLSVMLNAEDKVQVEHRVRLDGGGWQAFELPLACFTRTQWQDPVAPKDGVFKAAKLQGLGFSPLGMGQCRVLVGPVSVVEGKAALKDGQMEADAVQDFVGLEAGAYGSFADAKGSRCSLSITAGAPGAAGITMGLLDYELKEDGWCGEWIRAGADWKGQDWSAAKAVQVEAYCEQAVVLQLAFNDANQNAYVGDGPALTAGKWVTVSIPMKSFVLNPYYQPPQAKKGAKLDLGHVETFNLSPRSQGKHQVWVKKVRLER